MSAPLITDVFDFQRSNLTFEGTTKPVLITGESGPAVVVIHEIYGFAPTVARLCRWVRDAGFRIYAPILFGRPDAKNKERPTLNKAILDDQIQPADLQPATDALLPRLQKLRPEADAEPYKEALHRLSNQFRNEAAKLTAKSPVAFRAWIDSILVLELAAQLSSKDVVCQSILRSLLTG
jgi:dienelactone hydrolase